MADTPQSGKRKTRAQYKKLAQLLANDTPIVSALVSAGWSPGQAKKGKAAVPDAVWIMIPKKAQELIAMGKADRETRGNLVRGRLVKNIITGKDGGAMSARILGSEKDLGMWQPDMQVGQVLLNVPQYALDHKAELLKGFEDSEPGPPPEKGQP